MATQPFDEYDGQLVNPDWSGGEVQETAQSSRRSTSLVEFSTNVLKDEQLFSTRLASYDTAPNADLNGNEESSLLSTDMEERLEQMASNGEYDFANSTSEEFDDWLMKELDTMQFERIDRSILDRTMYVAIQPPAEVRRRYLSDHKRQIEKSRSKPMAIQLPDLTQCQLDAHQSFWLQLVLITSAENSAGKAFKHADKLEYHAEDSSERAPGYLCVPLTPADIQTRTKQLARIAIIKTKLDAYPSALEPYEPTSPETQIGSNNTTNKCDVAKAKVFRDDYRLKSSRIACQLLLKSDGKWHKTDIVCETDLMEEKDKPSLPKKAPKRSAPADEHQPIGRSRAKKPKCVSSPADGLPVTDMRSTRTDAVC